MRCINPREGRKIKGDSADRSDYIWLAITVGTIIAFGVAWRVNSTAAAIVAKPAGYPTPAALEAAGRYLRPIALTAALRSVEPVELFSMPDYYARPQRSEPTGGEPSTAGPARPRWVVSAILVTDARHMAVVNDSVVQVGWTLPGGARIIEIQSDRVVLQESGGVRRVISLNR